MNIHELGVGRVCGCRTCHRMPPDMDSWSPFHILLCLSTASVSFVTYLIVWEISEQLPCVEVILENYRMWDIIGSSTGVEESDNLALEIEICSIGDCLLWPSPLFMESLLTFVIIIIQLNCQTPSWRLRNHCTEINISMHLVTDPGWIWALRTKNKTKQNYFYMNLTLSK